MAKYCGECALCDIKNKRRYSDEYYCKDKKLYVSLTDRRADRCNSFIFDPSCRNNKGSFKPSGFFYIVTAVNNILGLGSDSKLIKIMYNAGFLMKKDKDHALYEMLFNDYDITGSLIADELWKEKNKEEIATEIYNGYLLPIMNLIENKDNNAALKSYVKMIDDLKEKYSIGGEFDLKYVYDAAIDYEDDILCRTLSDQDLDVEHNSDITSTLYNYFKNIQNPELLDLYNAVGIEMTDIAYGENTDKINKYYSTYLKVLATDIKKNKLNEEEVMQQLNNLLFSIRVEKTFNTSHENIVTRQRILPSNR